MMMMMMMMMMMIIIIIIIVMMMMMIIVITIIIATTTTTITATITITTIIIAFKGAIRDVLQSHWAANRLQHVRSSGPGVIVCQKNKQTKNKKKSVTNRALITCNMLRATLHDGTAQLLSLTEFTSHLFPFYYLG